jgi:hypothetical protein
MPQRWFDDIPVIGNMPKSRAIDVLRSIDEGDLAALIESQAEPSQRGHFGDHGNWWGFPERLWQHTAHSFGYIPLAPAGTDAEIIHAGAIAPDLSLRNEPVKITLDRLRVADYPGRGTHHILFDFYAQNQLNATTEHLHFNALRRVKEGEEAPVSGCPVFVGINVGPEGLDFKCYTVNVRNDEDERFLRFLDSDTFRSGLKLAVTAQPAIALFSETALALTRSIAQRNRNVPVQDFHMGLDFSSVATRARLAEGSYIAVQIPESHQVIWDWSEWIYQSRTGHIVRRANGKEKIPYNYLVLGLSRQR